MECELNTEDEDTSKLMSSTNELSSDAKTKEFTIDEAVLPKGNDTSTTAIESSTFNSTGSPIMDVSFPMGIKMECEMGAKDTSNLELKNATNELSSDVTISRLTDGSTVSSLEINASSVTEESSLFDITDTTPRDEGLQDIAPSLTSKVCDDGELLSLIHTATNLAQSLVKPIVKDNVGNSCSETLDIQKVGESCNNIDDTNSFASLKNTDKPLDHDLIFVHDYGRKESSDSDSDSDSSASAHSAVSSSSVSSVDSAVVVLEKEKARTPAKAKTNNKNQNFLPPFKTPGELGLEDLPPIEDLHITVPEQDIRHIGRVSSIVQTQVIIQSFENERPLDLDTVLFLKDGTALGKIFDVFGRVSAPFYSVRFNSEDDIKTKGILVLCNVYYAPGHNDVTSFVFTEKLLMQKGSDASWRDNNEPPEECLEFSDDEQERMHRMKLKAKRKAINEDDPNQITQSSPRLKNENSERRKSKAGASLVRPNRFNAPTPDLNSNNNSQNAFRKQFLSPPSHAYPSQQSQFQQMATNSQFQQMATNSQFQQMASNSQFQQMASNSQFQQMASNSQFQQMANNSQFQQMASNSQVQRLTNNSQFGNFQRLQNYQANTALLGNPFIFGAPPGIYNNPFAANRFINPNAGSPLYTPLVSNVNTQPFPSSWGANPALRMQFTQPPPQTRPQFPPVQNGSLFGNQLQNTNQLLMNYFTSPPPPPPPS